MTGAFSIWIFSLRVFFFGVIFMPSNFYWVFSLTVFSIGVTLHRVCIDGVDDFSSRMVTKIHSCATLLGMIYLECTTFQLCNGPRTCQPCVFLLHKHLVSSPKMFTVLSDTVTSGKTCYWAKESLPTVSSALCASVAKSLCRLGLIKAKTFLIRNFLLIKTNALKS